MIREVLKYGDARLLEYSCPVVDFGGQELRTLVADLWDTMEQERGVGIAAPQVGVRLRVLVLGFQGNARYPDADPVPKMVLINPVISPLGVSRQAGWEGCLSVPGWRGPVERWSRIRYFGQDESGSEIAGIAEGFHARVIQHECDHLDGILYPMRMCASSQLGAVTSST
jgi:peptide deformylase